MSSINDFSEEGKKGVDTIVTNTNVKTFNSSVESIVVKEDSEELFNRIIGQFLQQNRQLNSFTTQVP